MFTTDDYICDRCHQTMTVAKREGFLCHCGGIFKYIHLTFAIHGFEHPNEVGSSADGNYDTRKDISLTLKQLESKGRLDELSKDDIQFYQEYVKK